MKAGHDKSNGTQKVLQAQGCAQARKGHQVISLDAISSTLSYMCVCWYPRSMAMYVKNRKV